MKSLRKVIDYIGDCGEGVKILCRREFWSDFLEYYSAEEISKRLNEFAQDVERRNEND